MLLTDEVIDIYTRTKAILMLTPTPTQINKTSRWAFAMLVALTLTTATTTAASLFGDLSCEAWADLDLPTKKTWTNAFLAPLSLTHQGLARAKQDRYNDDPKAVNPAIVSIDTFCLSYPKNSPADGAIAYLNALIEN